MANPTLRVSPGNVPEGGEVTFVLTDGIPDTCYKIRITDLTDLSRKAKGRIPDQFLYAQQATKAGGELRWGFSTSGLAAGRYEAVVVTPTVARAPAISGSVDGVPECDESAAYTEEVQDTARTFSVGGAAVITRTFLQRSSTVPTADQALWVAIRNRTAAISFPRYNKFINLVFGCEPNSTLDVSNLLAVDTALLGTGTFARAAEGMEIRPSQNPRQPHLNVQGPYAYSLLKFATQVYLSLESGVVIRDGDTNGHRLFNAAEEAYRLNDPTVTIEGLTDRLKQYWSHSAYGDVLPYLHRIVGALLAVAPADTHKEVLPYCYNILQHRFTQPSLLELIWSYWHEEGMLAQVMNTIALRFQNQRSGAIDPLAELELDPLRPLNNLIWGYVQDEHNRLTVRRRAFEYDHHYGLKLLGRAVPELQTADSRSKFLEAFHNLLYRTAIFYREDSDTTVIADAFPLLNALKDVHLLLAEGAHNQYGDLPWTARGEMLTQQWMLARPEMREFLRGRHMVPYQEDWMGAVDAMKKLQGWTDTTITHFHELAVDGERLLLSIRFGDWSELDNIEEQARNWARYWKPEVQRYLYGYLAATGVDLMADITDSREAATRYLQPSALLQRRLAAQTRQPALSARGVEAAVAVGASGGVALPRRVRVPALKYETGE